MLHPVPILCFEVLEIVQFHRLSNYLGIAIKLIRLIDPLDHPTTTLQDLPGEGPIE